MPCSRAAWKPAKRCRAEPPHAGVLLRAAAFPQEKVVCPARLGYFGAVSQWYADFPQATDEEVRQLLDDAHREHARQASRPQ
jgi:putative phosphoribosyl transferase